MEGETALSSPRPVVIERLLVSGWQGSTGSAAFLNSTPCAHSVKGGHPNSISDAI